MIKTICPQRGSGARLMASLLVLTTLSQLTLRCPAAEPIVVERGPNHKTWRITEETLVNGRVRTRSSGYTEMASGLHYLNQQGQWSDSQEIIELFQDGAIARQGQIQVIWSPNLATAGAVDLLTPDGKRFRTHVLGLAFHDVATQQSELVAEVKSVF